MISLAEHNPELLKEWDYEKNKVDPKNVSYGTGEKAWWICPRGHNYYSSIYGRRKGSSCPYCSNNKVLKGFNDLETTNPGILKYWNFEKNILVC